MDIASAVDMGREALLLTLALGAPMLAAGLVVALIVSIFQAATGVQEHTLALLPKIVVMAAAALVTGAWGLGRLVEYAEQMFSMMP